MTAWWSGTAQTFLHTPRAAIVNALARRLVENHRTNHAEPLCAWHRQVAVLHGAIARLPDCHILLEYRLIRLGRRIDAVLIADRAIFALELKAHASGAITQAHPRQAEDYGLDLLNFHAESSVSSPHTPASRQIQPRKLAVAH